MEKDSERIGMFDRISVRYARSDNVKGPDISVTGSFVEWNDGAGMKTLTIKLENGYNIGISSERIVSMDLIEKRKAIFTGGSPSRGRIEKGSVALLSMGGTISSRVDYRTGAVHPSLSPSDLMDDLRTLGITSGVNPRVVRSILSEDMKPIYWRELANEIVDAFKEGAVGCVVTHGTDTMALTSAALSFLLRDLPGPVVLVGSQRSSDRPSSDAFMNLVDAISVARTRDLGEVCLTMHGSPSDDFTLIHRGTRVKKMHTSRRDAFVTVNSEPLGRVKGGKVELSKDHKPSIDAIPSVDGAFDERVVLLRSTPQIDAKLLGFAMGNYRAIVFEGTGLGHVRSDLIDVISEIVNEGIPVVMTSSCPFGMVNMNVYSTGRKLQESGVIPAYDMVSETALIKTMYILGSMPGTVDMEKFRTEFLNNMVGEIEYGTVLNSFGPSCKSGERGNSS